MTPAVSRLFVSTGALHAPEPPNDTARLILKALRAGRIAEANELIQRLPQESPLEQAWKNYLGSRIHLEQGDFAHAKSLAQRAASASLHQGLLDPIDPVALRLAASALELAGISLRRQDQPSAASRIHLAAFALRQEHGTPDEQAESAMSVGLCTEWIGNLAAAERWYRIATNLNVVEIDQARMKSSAFIRLSTLLTRLLRHDEATQAAQLAQELLNEFIPGDLTAISAGLNTAQAMIRHVENLLGEKKHDSARVLLKETSHLLQSTHESLSGFGSPAQLELTWCDEQSEFVERLRETVESIPNRPKHA